MPSGTGSNDYVRGWRCNAPGARALRQIACLLPDIFVNRKLREGAGKLLQNLLFLLSRGTIP